METREHEKQHKDNQISDKNEELKKRAYTDDNV